MPTPGSRIGPYEIVASLGSGGMGHVYRARDPRLGRDVAVKVLRDDVASDRDRVKRFEQEARSASALNHPNIVTIHDIGWHEEELADGLDRARGFFLFSCANLMNRRLPSRRLLALMIALVALATETAAQTIAAMRSLRLDYFHTGRVDTELFSFDRLVVEPLGWAGNPDRPVDDSGFGKYRFQVLDAGDGSVVYTRGFSSIYGEWETTAEAREGYRTFHESLRFPAVEPFTPVRVVVEKRDASNTFLAIWEIEIDPNDMFVDRSRLEADRPADLPLIEIERHGDPSHKVDLLLLGDGYTAEECTDGFGQDARQVVDILFSVEPFTSRRSDFNLWGLCPPSTKSGISRPSTGVHRRTPVGATYDAFGSERYVLSFENRAFRDVAAWAPYDVVEILVNNETYGGGGIFGLYATVAAKNDCARDDRRALGGERHREPEP